VICIDDDTVLGLIEGRIAPAALAGIEDHLDTCATCRDVVAHVAQVASPARVLERGTSVGRYVVGEPLGAGAMGRVYSAWEPELDRRVALKLLVSDGIAGGRERVVREAQAMARLSHPNVVGVHEVGTSEHGVYVAMELVDGDNLRAWAAAQRPWRDVVAVLAGAARGLAAVHAAGVIHRDFKPDNVIVGADGRARLGDFGLARAGNGRESEPRGELVLASGTPATAIAGTPAYMAPEVLRGGAATPASDQFSFGVTAYEALTGARPSTGATWTELLAAIEHETVAPIRGVPGWLDDTIRRCLAVDPADRFSSMQAVVDRLVAGAARRSPARWIASGLAAATLASVVTFFAVRGTTTPSGASCDVADHELAAVWTDAARAGLEPRAAAAVDRWVGAWNGERRAVCIAARSQPAPEIAARSRCLDERRAELAALLDRVGAAPSSSARAADALGVLASPGECRGIRAGAATPEPLDPARAASVRDVRAALPAIRAATALGDARPVVDEATRLVALARTSEHAPTLADALLALAGVLRGTSQLALAHEAARDAVAAAERGHDDLLAAQAWVMRVITAGDRRELALAEDFGAIAAAAVERAGSPPQLAATLLRLRGLVAYNRRELATARTYLEDSRARFVLLAGERSAEVAALDSALGSVARVAGDLDEAEARHRHALEVDRSVRGPDHPDVARDLHNLAGVQRLRGELDAAAQSYREALAIELATLGERSSEAGLTYNSLGLVELARKDLLAARGLFERARDALAAADHGDLAFARHNLGLVAAALGDHRTALAEYELAAAIYARTIGTEADGPRRLADDRARSQSALAAAGPRRSRPTAAPTKTSATTAATPQRSPTTAATVATNPPAPAPASTTTPTTPATNPRATAPAATATPTAPAAAPTSRAPEAAKRPQDVGVYGSTQPW
jgi:eukaryotic-like serine/threonine-protein kinase